MFRIKCVDCEGMFTSNDKDHVVCEVCWEEQNRVEEKVEEGCECGERSCMCPYFDVEPRIGKD